MFPLALIFLLNILKFDIFELPVEKPFGLSPLKNTQSSTFCSVTVVSVPNGVQFWASVLYSKLAGPGSSPSPDQKC